MSSPGVIYYQDSSLSCGVIAINCALRDRVRQFLYLFAVGIKVSFHFNYGDILPRGSYLHFASLP